MGNALGGLPPDAPAGICCLDLGGPRGGGLEAEGRPLLRDAAVDAKAHADAPAIVALNRDALVAAWLDDAVDPDTFYAGPSFTIARLDAIGVDIHCVCEDDAEDAVLDRQIIHEAAIRDVLLTDEVARGALCVGLRNLGYVVRSPP
jgi:hypothetical protein